MGNRVEDLEQQVAELRATVDGLTEELVETKERVAKLEGGEPDAGDDSESSHAEFVPNRSANDHADEAATSDPDTDATETSDRTDDDGDDDIIVA